MAYGSKKQSTVIVGAGIIGLSTAYYLSLTLDVDNHEIHVVENSDEFFASASGKAGGFLAEDWFSPLSAPLGALSFKLHKQLASQHNGREKWGYSLSTGSSYTQAPLQTTPAGGRKERGDDWLREGTSRSTAANPSEGSTPASQEFSNGQGPTWLTRQSGDEYEVISSEDSVAQVDPLKLCQFLLEECKARGVVIHQPFSPTEIVTAEENTLVGVKIRHEHEADDEMLVPCTSLLLTSGAWTPRVFSTLFPSSGFKIPITSLAGHSLVIRSHHGGIQETALEDNHAEKCHAVFSTSAYGFSPEIFSRVSGEIYIAGLNDAGIPLPRVATEAKIQKAEMDKLVETARRMCGGVGGEEEEVAGLGEGSMQVVREGLCFRPVSPKGVPILSRVPDVQLGDVKTAVGGGVFVAVGHGPWGISLSLGTGLVMSEMIRGVETTCDVRGLSL